MTPGTGAHASNSSTFKTGSQVRSSRLSLATQPVSSTPAWDPEDPFSKDKRSVIKALINEVTNEMTAPMIQLGSERSSASKPSF